MEPTREIYWNIVGSALLYVLAIAGVAVFAWGVFRHVQLWRLGNPEKRLDRIPERLRGLLAEVILQRRQRRRSFPALIHLLIFYGFLAQLAATSMISFQEWSGLHFLRGSFYLGYSLVFAGERRLRDPGHCRPLHGALATTGLASITSPLLHR